MPRFAILLSFMFMVSLFSGNFIFSTENYKTHTIGYNETPEDIASKFLRKKSFLPALLEFNNLSDEDELTYGTTIKIPFSLAKDRYAKIIYISGKLFKQSNNSSNWKELRINQVVKESDILKTDEDSRATVELDDGSRIRIMPKSIINLQNYKYNGNDRNSEIILKYGSLFAKVNHLTKKSSMTFKTSTGVAGVRGTKLYVEQDKKTEKMTVAVKKGVVNVEGKSKSVELESGYATVIEKGQNPTTPYKFDEPAFVEWVD